MYRNHSPLLFDIRILFQRGVYPADDFHMVKKYGQTILVTQDLALENYLEKLVAVVVARTKRADKHQQDSVADEQCVLYPQNYPKAALTYSLQSGY